MADEQNQRPVLRVVKGDASEQDVAVLTALVSAASAGDEQPPRTRRGGWSDPAYLARRRLSQGVNAWRSAFR